MGMENINDRSNKLKCCVGIAALIGGVSTGIVALIAIFSPTHLPVAGWIVSALCLMGAALGRWVARENVEA